MRVTCEACGMFIGDGDHDGDDHDDDDGDDGDGDHDDDDCGDGHDGHLRGYFTEGADDAEE